MPSLASGLSEVVGDDEDLARFLTQSSHFSRDAVRPSAFLPSPKDRATSVLRHGRQPIGRLKELGCAAAGSRLLYGAAIFKACDVRRAQLAVDTAEPPARHALITGWPWMNADPKTQKAQQKERALLLISTAGPPLLFNV